MLPVADLSLNRRPLQGSSRYLLPLIQVSCVIYDPLFSYAMMSYGPKFRYNLIKFKIYLGLLCTFFSFDPQICALLIKAILFLHIMIKFSIEGKYEHWDHGIFQLIVLSGDSTATPGKQYRRRRVLAFERHGMGRGSYILIKWIIQTEFTSWFTDIERCHLKISGLFCCFLAL